jgi:4-methyl-5(b-hydroxyethyl)-thiazole monophosphate biosynthesis
MEDNNMSGNSVLCILADGFEEIEAITVVDLLRRAHIQVITAGLDGHTIRGSHGIIIQCDSNLTDIDDTDFTHLFLPGGQPGAKNLKNSGTVLEIIRKFNHMNKGISVICAAPTVLQQAGILNGRQVTSYPAEKSVFSDSDYIERNIVEDGNIITSRGVGTAIEFALYLVEKLTDKETCGLLAERLLYK